MCPFLMDGYLVGSHVYGLFLKGPNFVRIVAERHHVLISQFRDYFDKGYKLKIDSKPRTGILTLGRMRQETTGS